MCDSPQAVARCSSMTTTRGASTPPSSRRLRSSRRPGGLAFWLVAALLGSCRGVAQAQQDDYDYGGYGQQQAPMRAGGGGEGGGLMKPLAAVATSFMAMKLILSRHRKKTSSKTLQQEQKKWAQMKKEDLQEINQQFNTMEATLTASLNEKVAQSRHLEQILYSLPDTDQNGLITRYEFDKYMNEYKRSHPGLTDRDLPRFEDMDHNNNGHINFHEWEEYQMMAMSAMV